MIVKLLTEHHLEFLSLTGGCRGSSKSTHVKMPHCCNLMHRLILYMHHSPKASSFSSVCSTINGPTPLGVAGVFVLTLTIPYKCVYQISVTYIEKENNG